MSRLITGNLTLEEEEHPGRGGWVLGQFREPDSPFHATDVEVKWSHHKRGWVKETTAANMHAKTLTILISGKFNIWFPDEGMDVLLEKQGDYCLFPERTFHRSSAPEDALVLTVRWPSVRDDVVTRD